MATQLRIESSDLQRFKSLMAQEGITGKQSEMFAALLDRLEEEREDQAQSVNEVTNTMQWFTAQIDELKAQVEDLTRERDHLTSQLAKQLDSQTTSKSVVQLPTKPAPSPPRISGESKDKVNSVIDALLAWNTAQEDRLQQVRISVPVIKALGGLIGATYQPAIQEATRERAAEIEDIHSRFMIGSRHNRSIPDKDAVLQAIARDYMGLEHWQEASFG